MKYIETHGLKLSRFSLGTVQLGMRYGVGNRTGKPNREQAFSILDGAMALGVNSLDTAAGYGDSEEIIGAWLRRGTQHVRPLITTKIANLDHSSPDALRACVREKVADSKARLGLEKIPLLMLHRYEDYAANPENTRAVFEELRQSGGIERWGISAYSRHDYRLLAASGADAVQIPVNVFDWKQIRGGGIAALRGAGIMIFARSVFLQGLIFQEPEALDPDMRFAAPALRRFRDLCAEFALEPAVLAASFALSLPGIACLVLGCERRRQVEDNAALIERTEELTGAQMARLEDAFADIDQHVIDPSTWHNNA